MAKRKSDGSLCEERGFKVTSGAVEEYYSFEWKIENYLVVNSSNEAIDDQIFHFEAGTSLGTPTRWHCRLLKQPDNQTTGIFLRMCTAPPKFKAIASYWFETIKPNNATCKNHQVTLKEFTGQTDGYGSGEMIPGDEKELKELIWEDGSIVIKLTLKMFLFRPVAAIVPNMVDVQKEVKCFEMRELQKLSDSMTRMIELDGQAEAGKIIKVVSKDGVGFNASTASLSARSPVFKAMFESGNWKEGQNSSGGGAVAGRPLVLTDLSGKTLKVLLHFLMGGVLLKEDWMAEDVILELTYAADKYQLEGLTGFLDKVLPAIPFKGTEILAKLALLTNKLGMKIAEKGLFSKLKETATDINQLILDKGGSLLGKD